MRLSGLILILILHTAIGMGQNLLGYDSDYIKNYIKKNHPELVMESNFKNDHYNYLKFTDGNSGSETILFFLSDKERCTSVKAIYDLSRKDELITNLDESYRRVDENRWTDRNNGINAVITLQDEEWFVTVSIKPDK